MKLMLLFRKITKSKVCLSTFCLTRTFKRWLYLNEFIVWQVGNWILLFEVSLSETNVVVSKNPKKQLFPNYVLFNSYFMFQLPAHLRYLLVKTRQFGRS